MSNNEAAAKFRVEFYATNPPKPISICEMANGKPIRVLAVLSKASSREACVMVDALNAMENQND